MAEICDFGKSLDDTRLQTVAFGVSYGVGGTNWLTAPSRKTEFSAVKGF
jgi:hypothetical protein